MLAEAKYISRQFSWPPHQLTERVNLPLPQLLRQIWRLHLQLVG